MQCVPGERRSPAVLLLALMLTTTKADGSGPQLSLLPSPTPSATWRQSHPPLLAPCLLWLSIRLQLQAPFRPLPRTQGAAWAKQPSQAFTIAGWLWMAVNWVKKTCFLEGRAEKWGNKQVRRDRWRFFPSNTSFTAHRLQKQWWPQAVWNFPDACMDRQRPVVRNLHAKRDQTRRHPGEALCTLFCNQRNKENLQMTSETSSLLIPQLDRSGSHWHKPINCCSRRSGSSS